MEVTTVASSQPPEVQGRRLFRARAAPTTTRGPMSRPPASNAPSRSPWCPPARDDRDACGIGLVADAEGRASRALVDSALVGLAGVRHRSAVAADGVSGDGAGVLLPIPQAFFARVAGEAGLVVPGSGTLGVVNAFLDAADGGARRTAEAAVAEACAAEGLVLLGWRSVPTDEARLGAAARHRAPSFTQAILALPPDDTGRGDGAPRHR